MQPDDRAETNAGGARRPVPEITDQTRSFWAAAAQHRLEMQKCMRCQTLNFLPKPWCVECGSRDLRWTPVRPTGVVYSHTTAYKVMMNYPGWNDELPVVLLIVDLDDGARMYGRLVGCPPHAVQIGMAVTADFELVDTDVAVPVFRPAAVDAAQADSAAATDTWSPPSGDPAPDPTEP